ncbi:unnamed protein product [Mycena citricolor]|uniref:Uncharacterized protein n=1 Tax=Mycena citricolor TaxID=2018698 RepID=A0AAD2HIL6_9AGAR|nr:unnamed protein product [Mycena citricolor]CAK5276487.1 unnamed protein product [Mycena citricolor]
MPSLSSTSLFSCLLLLSCILQVHGEWTLHRSDLGCRFSLAAWNMTEQYTNTTMMPLVLANNAPFDGPSYEITSTFASYPVNVYPTLSLVNGSLRAYRASGAWLTNATAVQNGDLLTWYTSPLFNHDAARIYSVVQSPVGMSLSAYGEAGLWFLCSIQSKFTPPMMSVVFNLTRDSHVDVVDPDACWSTRITLVPVAGSAC